IEIPDATSRFNAFPPDAPVPSWPTSLPPQHSVVTFPQGWAHVCESPRVIATALRTPVTLTGVLRSVDVPSPNPPDELSPQHLTAPLVTTAHMWASPPSSAVAPMMPAFRATCGFPAPQHVTTVFGSRAHV